MTSETTGKAGDAVLSTDLGDIVINFKEDDAPQHVANFKKLAAEGFYNGTAFHRVIPNFMVQGGDPLSKEADRSRMGTGGPGYTVPAEIKGSHVRGSLAAARLGDMVNPQRASSGSQFYICVVDTPHLDGQYTVYGEVVDGMDVVDKIVAAQTDSRDNPLEPIRINTVTLASE